MHPDERHNNINPNNEVDIDRLRESMSWSAQRLAPFRERYIDAVRYFAGNRYGGSTDLDKTPMNLMRLAVEIWLRQLVAQTPRALVLTRQPILKVNAFELQIAVDHLLEEINFGDNLSNVVRSAIFQLGILKIGITDPYIQSANFTAETGQPFAEPVLFEDWLHDMNARRKEEWDWCGNRYRVPYKAIMENPNFKNKEMIKPEESEDLSDLFGESTQRTSHLSSDDVFIKNELVQHIDLWDIWIPGEKLLVTMPAQSGTKPLLIKEWEGPENGPFHLLSFSLVPGNVMPNAPAQHLFDLQDLITRLFNQLGRQAARQKTLTIADGRAVEDGTAERIMEGEDGQVIRTSHIDGIREMKYGGVDQGNLAFVMWLREIYSYLAGNMDAMGGLARQAETLGQEQLLVQSSSQMIQDMQKKVVDYTKDVVSDLAWYLYTDPLIEIPLIKRLEGYGEIPFVWGQDSREGDFFDYNFEVQPYSLQHKGPEQRLATIMQLTQSLLLPLAPQFPQMGLHLDLPRLIDLISKYGDLPEINDIVISAQPTMYEEVGPIGGKGERPTQSPITTRNYTRRGIPGQQQQGPGAGMMEKLLTAAGGGQ